MQTADPVEIFEDVFSSADAASAALESWGVINPAFPAIAEGRKIGVLRNADGTITTYFRRLDDDSTPTDWKIGIVNGNNNAWARIWDPKNLTLNRKQTERWAEQNNQPLNLSGVPAETQFECKCGKHSLTISTPYPVDGFVPCNSHFAMYAPILPDVRGANLFEKQLDSMVLPPTVQVVENTFGRGHTVLISGMPKTGKSSLVMDFAVKATRGVDCDWLGRKIIGNYNVILIDPEMDLADIKARRLAACNRLNLSHDSKRFLIRSTMGYRLTIDELIDEFIEYGNCHGEMIFIFESMVRLLPPDVDENHNVAIAKLFDRLDELKRKTNSTLILTHHTSKGDNDKKSVLDMPAGAGSWSRCPFTVIALWRHATCQRATVGIETRSYGPSNRFVISVPDCKLVDDADANQTQQGNSRVISVDECVAFVVAPVLKVQLPRMLKKTFNCTLEAASGVLAEAISTNKLEEFRQPGSNAKWIQRPRP